MVLWLFSFNSSLVSSARGLNNVHLEIEGVLSMIKNENAGQDEAAIIYNLCDLAHFKLTIYILREIQGSSQTIEIDIERQEQAGHPR